MAVVLLGFATINMGGAAVRWAVVCCTHSQVSTPSTVAEFLKLDDNDVKANREVHGVSHELAGHGSVGCEVRCKHSPRARAWLQISVRSLWFTAYALSMKLAWKSCIETSAIYHTGQTRPT